MTTLDVDILHPSVEYEARVNKKKTLVPNPRSEFLSLRCQACMALTTAFSHSNTQVVCQECGATLAYPTGGKIKLAEGVQSRPRIAA